MVSVFTPKEDKPGAVPPKISGRREKNFFDAEEAAHKLELAKMDSGFVGRFLGGPRTVASLAALIVILFSSVTIIVCLLLDYSSPTGADFWQKGLEGAFALLGTSLGFLFGKGSSERN
jgi:hypothetical protein